MEQKLTLEEALELLDRAIKTSSFINYDVATGEQLDPTIDKEELKEEFISLWNFEFDETGPN